MTPTDKELLDMQLRIQMGMSWDDADLPAGLKTAWDSLQQQVDVLADNGVLVDVVAEWSDFEDGELAEIYAEWTPEELEAYNNGIMLDDARKSADGPTLVSKAVEERMFTLGPMYIPNVRDAHNEWTDPDELQKAVWEYVRKGDRRIRLQHDRDKVAGEFVEIMAWPYEVEVPIVMKDSSETSMSFPPNTVFLGVVWEPWAWEMVKAGKLRGYSIGGRAERLLADLPEDDE
jgi:hypothetical protein